MKRLSTALLSLGLMGSLSAAEQRGLELDQADPLAYTKELFAVPPGLIHLGGHSLGPTYQGSVDRVLEEYDVRNQLILGGHFASTHPAAHGEPERGRHWFDCDRNAKALAALGELVGADASELVMGNSLTVNNALMIQAFYMPNLVSGRCKILMMEHSFASDQAVLMSVLRQKLQLLRCNGVDVTIPDDPALLREAFFVLLRGDQQGRYQMEELEAILEEQGDQIALAHLEAIPFSTGQRFYSPEVTRQLKEHGITAGWDLAHMVGNRPAQLSEDGVDYATWCGYKYLCASAGGVGGYFINKRNKPFEDYFPAQGWKAMRSEAVFAVIHSYDASILHQDVRSTRLGNPPPIAMGDAQAVLELYHDVGPGVLAAKSERLTRFLIEQLDHHMGEKITWITPLDPDQRGAMLVFAVDTDLEAHAIESAMLEQGFALDVRPPANIRVMPHPLYVSFEEVEGFATALAQLCR